MTNSGVGGWDLALTKVAGPPGPQGPPGPTANVPAGYLIQPSEMTQYRTPGMNVPTGVWTAVTAWTGSQDVKGNEFGSAGSGVVCATGGRYKCECSAVMPTGGARRGIAASTPVAGNAVIVFNGPVVAGQPGNYTVSQTISMPAGGTISISLYQDSGATIIATSIQIIVKREP